MRRLRSQRGVLVGRGQSAARQRRVVVAVDDVVLDPRVIGVLLLDPLQQRRRLQQVRVGLVAVVPRLVQRERVENRRLDVVWIRRGQRPHRTRVVPRAGLLVDGAEVAVLLAQGHQPPAFARGLRIEREPAVHGIQPPLEHAIVERPDQRIRALADGETPVRDGAGRIEPGDRRKGVHRLGEEERVQHRERTIELALRLRRTRGLEVRPPERTLTGVVVVLRGRRHGAGHRGRDDAREERTVHGLRCSSCVDFTGPMPTMRTTASSSFAMS